MLKSMRLFTCAVLFILPLAAGPAQAPKDDLLKQKMVNDLDIIKSSFEVKYAPIDWKKSYSNWDLDDKIAKAKNQILSKKTITVEDYQHLIHDFFLSCRDYHVGVTFNSTASSYLPFRIQSAEGKYFVVWTDSAADLPFSKGDEVLEFDGKPIADVIRDLKQYEQCDSQSLTDQSKIEMLLTERVGASGHLVPQGPVGITLKHANAKKQSKYVLEWSYSPEEIHNDKVYRKAASRRMSAIVKQKRTVSEHPYLHRQMLAAFYPAMRTALKRQYGAKLRDCDEVGPDPVGHRKSFVPTLGKLTWESEHQANFHAYMFETEEGRTIGYVRIADYQGGSAGCTAAAKEFLDLVTMFEQETDALVIDQVNNPGGEVFYMYALVSMLADKPLKLPTHRMTLTQQDVQYAFNTLDELKKYSSTYSAHIFLNTDDNEDSISGYPVTPELTDSLNRHFHFIIDEWNAGNMLSSPGYLFGIEEIPPHPTARYSKPILLLTNEMAFSCGDFLPAILQDNRRATIFGAKTGGAGGFIMEQSHPNFFGIEDYTFTASIAERLDHKPIENLGVTPDIPYTITADDIKNGYPGYRAAALKALNSLFKKKR